MTQNKLDRNYFDLENELDQIFAIDRISDIESDEEFPASLICETYSELLGFYQRLVGRRIAVRGLLAGKTGEQSVEEELQHLRETIKSIIAPIHETIDSKKMFGEIVPLREQKKVWKAIFADFPGLLQWHNSFFPMSLLFLLFGIPLLLGLLRFLFPVFDIKPLIGVFIGVGGFVVLISIILLQIFYFSHRWCYHRLTLRQIAEKVVEAKKQFADYPVVSVEDVEPMMRQVFSDKFDVPFDSLKPVSPSKERRRLIE
ncbi:hypothetical protein FACS189443_4380 [Planctomycetales bacterium]|nr:hypothetical protein FACS189443_4380 [Planctomycetales bacterium]